MLVYFKVGNYKSIKDPIIINFNATAINEHQKTNVYQKNKAPLLKTVLLYGPNASGKSKILDAFVFFRSFILKSATAQESQARIHTEPFLLNTISREQPSFFEAEFFVGAKRYQYGFEASREEISREWLFEVKSTTTQHLFLRIEQQVQIEEKRIPEAIGLDKRMRKNALFLSVAAQWNVLVAEKISAWFSQIATIHGLLDDPYKRFTTNLLQKEGKGSIVNDLIQKADLGISGLHIVEVTDDLINQIPEELQEKVTANYAKDNRDVRTLHEVYDENNEVVELRSFSLIRSESEGTKKFYNIAGLLLEAVKNGRLVVIDELDARLHPMLIRAIIQMFNNSNENNGAQLLGVSHDTALIDRNFLRRDQICFVEKDNYGATKVSTLVEFKVRKEAPFEKNYLEGKYGAIPFINGLESVISDGK